MLKVFFSVFTFISSISLLAQQHSMSLGIYTGITIPYTLDEGINEDPRYKARYNVKFAPFGIQYGMDYDGFGLLISPGLINLGQDAYVVNTSGGQDGLRELDLTYLQVPVGFKLHIIDLDFFKVSAIASISGAFLLEAKEQISHSDTKLKFPSEVYPILPAEYIVEYDGVLVPTVTHYPMLKKEDFKSTQFFAAAGFRSDWDVSNTWRVSLDFRVNYGILDPRTDDYLEKLKAYQSLYDIPGRRRDTFVQFNIGIARYIEFDKSDKDRKKKLKGNSKKYTPRNYARPKPKG